jgi:catalase
MSFSLCRLFWGFSVLLISSSMVVFGSDASAQVHQKRQPNYLSLPINTSEAEAHTWQAQSHDYQSAGSLAMSAADQCYIEKDLDECDKLREIQNTISTWCAQDDQNACELYNIVMDYSMSVQSNQMQRDMVDQIQVE